jgi:hypothetical protein
MTRAGYLQWREGLKKFHAEKSGEILRQAGYDDALIARVQSINLKKNLGADDEVQVIEDALCLVFLEHQFAELAGKTPEDKMIVVLQKTWKKMSPAGHAATQKLALEAREKSLLERAFGQT